MRGVLSLVVLSLAGACALRLPAASASRRQALVGVAAAVCAPQAAWSKSKASSNPNKQCNQVTDYLGNEVTMCAGANAKDSVKELYTAQKKAMAGDKGSRGTEIAKGYEEREAQRLKVNTQNGGRIRGDSASRSKPDPAALGLKPYTGS